MLKDFNPALEEKETILPEMETAFQQQFEDIAQEAETATHEAEIATQEAETAAQVVKTVTRQVKVVGLGEGTVDREVVADGQFFMDLTLEWMEAWKVRDVKKLDDLVAEEFCFVSRRVKNMSADKTAWQRMAIEQYKLEQFEVEFITLNIHEYAAVVVYRLTMMIQPSYSNLPEKFVVTDVWARTSGQWKAISRQPIPV